ncbi:MAG: hypothetical protein HWE24_03595 [Oceanospirillaceae bacterium]|nr:hypothetical protein [Oceanospirillaceae bacterium]
MSFKTLLLSIHRLIVTIYTKAYQIKNHKKSKILIYTDSRGFEITKAINRKAPFQSYINNLIKNYNCEVYICPEKHTTFYDFFNVLNNKSPDNYFKIICHIGVVDFSPRGHKTVPEILNLKKHKIISQFGNNFFKNLLAGENYETTYYGDQTKSLLGKNQLKDLATKLNSIPNLIWISCNPVLLDWDGNYFRKRPRNINIVNQYSKDLIALLNNTIDVIDLTKLSKSEIKELTCDNIHLSLKGMEYILKKLELLLK